MVEPPAARPRQCSRKRHKGQFGIRSPNRSAELPEPLPGSATNRGAIRRWSPRQIQKAIGVRRETISVYLRAAGVAMRAPRGQIIPAKPASREDGVITDPACAN